MALWAALLAITTGILGVVVTLSLTKDELRSNARAAPLAPAAGPARAGRPARGQLGGLLPGVAPAPVQQNPLATRQGRQVEGRRVGRIIDSSRVTGLLIVVGLSGLSVLTAWFVAGRMLRPIRTMTSTARQVTRPGSGRRMGLDGPNDELHELADTIDEMLDRIDVAFDAQRRFVADASHELRTPLAVLRAEVDVALDNPDASPEDLRRSLERLNSELVRTSRLVESLLHLARAESLTTSVPHDLASSAEEAIATARRLGLGSRTVRHDLSTAPVVGDPLLLDRCVSNLVENAFRYNVDDGAVVVRTTSHDGDAIVTVENDGPVLDGPTVDGLFDRFRRGAMSTSRAARADGHGLGLSIVRTVVATHGGSVSLEPRPSGGLIAVVRLPKAGRAAEGRA